jgi:hypothetical protein
LLRKKILTIGYKEWKDMGFSKGTLHYMKKKSIIENQLKAAISRYTAPHRTSTKDLTFLTILIYFFVFF